MVYCRFCVAGRGRSFTVVAVVFYDEVYHQWGVRVKVAICLLCFVGVVVCALLKENVGRPVKWGWFSACHALRRPGHCCDGWCLGGFAGWWHHASVG